MDQLAHQLTQLGVDYSEAQKIASHIKIQLKNSDPIKSWARLLQADDIVTLTAQPFAVQELLYRTLYPDWEKEPAPAWFPTDDFIKTTNITQLMKMQGFENYPDFQQWSVTAVARFWQMMVEHLAIRFDQPYSNIMDISAGIEKVRWFQNAKMNITNSCFQAADQKIAIVSQNENGDLIKTSYLALDKLSNRIANSLSLHFNIGDRLAIVMPMTVDAVALYLAIIKAGMVVVGIPDSFVGDEISKRLKIANVKAVFTQDELVREGKTLPLYERMKDADAPQTIVLPARQKIDVTLRAQDRVWPDFLSENEHFSAVSSLPDEIINILFSSGTTGLPKAIPWQHSTPIKCASDAYLHQNIQADDIFCWPTNLGWMMGPWLIFACLMNKATLALCYGAPNGESFGKFIQEAKVTILGVVPTMVKTWRATKCMERFNWQGLKLFTSTGECSNVQDMLYLMSLAHYRPIIEYCGGTEIGGAYITGTVLQPCAPATFTTPALGSHFVILDEQGHPSDYGEVALIPPTIGLSTRLLNKDHHQIYYEGMPSFGNQILRRHGDQIKWFKEGYYRLLGRVDDTMKLSGIKISSAEIESLLNSLPHIYETAAIAVEPPGGGPSELIIFVVAKNQEINLLAIKNEMQILIKNHLNPLFKIYDVILTQALPRTASNKILRRVLKAHYSPL